jgi:DNA-binding XRE family transcriptional regulator
VGLLHWSLTNGAQYQDRVSSVTVACIVLTRTEAYGETLSPTYPLRLQGLAMQVRSKVDSRGTRPPPAGLGALFKSGVLMAAQMAVKPHMFDVLSRNVRIFRLAAGFTQERCAERCGIYRSYLARIEKGKANPSITVLGALAITLHVDLRQLFLE